MWEPRVAFTKHHKSISICDKTWRNNLILQSKTHFTQTHKQNVVKMKGFRDLWVTFQKHIATNLLNSTTNKQKTQKPRKKIQQQQNKGRNNADNKTQSTWNQLCGRWILFGECTLYEWIVCPLYKLVIICRFNEQFPIFVFVQCEIFDNQKKRKKKY